MQNAVGTFAESVGQGVALYQQGRQSQQRNALAQRELDQRQQQIDMQKVTDASSLALQQARTRQAEYELAFTKEIHNTKTIQFQREQIEAQTALMKAQVSKAIQDLGPNIPFGPDFDETVLSAASVGVKIEIGPNGRAIVSKDKMTPEEIGAAKKRLREMGEEAMAPKMALQQLKDENAILRAELAAWTRLAVADRTQEGATQRTSMTEEGKDRRTTQTEEGRNVRATQAEEGRNKRAEERLSPEKARARIKLIQTRLQALKTRTDPAAEQEREDLNAQMDQIDRQLGGESSQPSQAGGTAMDKAIEAFLKTRPGGR